MKYSQSEVHRIFVSQLSNPIDGEVSWSMSKSLWYSSISIIALTGASSTLSVDSILIFLFTTALVLCLGHSLGMHRKLIHNSFECPLWLEYFMVYCGVLTGLSGPISLMETHEMRDWAQRQRQSHPYFGHKSSLFIDAWWQLHCDITLKNTPQFKPEPRVAEDRFYQFLEKTWMLQQLPIMLLLYLWGGWPYVFWGGFLRVFACITGHWLIGYFAHNDGHQQWRVEGASVQGYNIPFCGLITMGECWHNNHHAYPGSAKLGLQSKQSDPGWWVLRALEKIKLVKQLRLPEDLPERPQLKLLNHG